MKKLMWVLGVDSVCLNIVLMIFKCNGVLLFVYLVFGVV